MIERELCDAARGLLDKANLTFPFTLHPLTGGGNNRVFRVDVDGQSLLLKAYFHHPADGRDRLNAEFAFCSFAWGVGIRSVPKPIASDPETHTALYEFIAGCSITSEEVNKALVQHAIEFYIQLNDHRHAPGATALANASEACFSIASHLQHTERRMTRLRGLHDSSSVDHEAAVFIRRELSAAWRTVQDGVRTGASKIGIKPEDDLPAQDRRLSPSDFGFHNAIRGVGGRTGFVDFEYAGWDDPAKMACDFFCQVAVPVPESYYLDFITAITAGHAQPSLHRQRIALLMPVHQIKWCCILLNEFLPISGLRRQYARGDFNPEAAKAAQLRKARLMLQRVVSQN